jgi:speckle-type POZ protein
VLAARSPVFRAELFGPMKEGSTTSGVNKVDDMEAPVFEAVLKFIYTDPLPPEMEEERCDQDVATMWQHLLVAADRYDLQRLRLMCEERLCQNINVRTATTTLALAEQHRCRGLKEACLEFLKCPANLKKVMAIDGLDHCCPSVLKDLIAKLLTH